MRTAIYVHEPGTFTIHPRGENDRNVELIPYNTSRPKQPASGTLKLARGIYAIVSGGPLHVAGINLHIETQLNDKDEWPEVHATVAALENANTREVTKFFNGLVLGLDDG